MSEPRDFSPRILIAWVAALAALFALSLYLAASDLPAVDSVGPNAQSKSAIGYAGLAELLRRRGLQVDAATTQGDDDPSQPSLRIVTEPRVDAQDEGARLGPSGSTVVLVLPRWAGRADPDHKGWISAAIELDSGVVRWALARSGATGSIARVPANDWWTTNRLGAVPSFSADMHLLLDTPLEPIVATGQLMLVGERSDRGTRVIVVADPDILSNHGLFNGGNAAFAAALIDFARGEAKKIVFDDRVRGRVARNADDNLFRRLFQPPFLAVAASVLAALAVLLAATMGRFGRPEPLAPILAAGKHDLIANAARLVAFSPHRSVIVARYTEGTVRSLARHFHAPPELAGAPLVEWLGRMSHGRGVRGDIVAMSEEARTLADHSGAESSVLVDLAQRVHRWRKDMLDAR